MAKLLDSVQPLSDGRVVAGPVAALPERLEIRRSA
jgi:hypothetical protein